MVEKYLKIYADSFNAKCYHYQDYKNREIDSVIELENGKAPSVLCVICGLTNAAYKRSEGVYVVPITALKP